MPWQGGAIEQSSWPHLICLNHTNHASASPTSLAPCDYPVSVAAKIRALLSRSAKIPALLPRSPSSVTMAKAAIVFCPALSGSWLTN